MTFHIKDDIPHGMYVDTNRTACRGLFSSYIALVFRVNRRRRSSRARSDAFVRVQVQMVFCYTIDRSMSTSRNIASDDFAKSRGSELTWKKRFHVKATTS